MSDKAFVSFKLYHGKTLVTFSVPLGDEDFTIDDFDGENADFIRSKIQALYARGFSDTEQDAVEGEKTETVWQVCRREKGDGTPIIDFYAQHEAMIHKFFSHYLNDDGDIEDFERVSGVVFKDLPLYEGNSALTKDDQKAFRYLREAPLHPHVTLAPNPYYEEGGKKAKYKFGSWTGGGSNPNLSTNASMNGSSQKTENESSERGGSRNHWSENEVARQMVANAFSEFGIVGRDKILFAMHRIEPGVEKLSDSRAYNEFEYIEWIGKTFAPADDIDVPF